MRVALKFAYDGRKTHGFARQPNVETIEGTLIDVLIKLKFISNPKTALFRAASRTDKGVSALGNVIAFNTDKKIQNIQKDCNNNLEHILVYGIKKVPSDFYPRYAKQRIYRYYLNKNDYEYNLLNSAASLFKGTYDFSNFARVESYKNPVRTIDDIDVYESEDFFVFDFFAQTYLWQQVRRMISAIEKVAKKKITNDQMYDALKYPGKTVDFGLARPEPLILRDVIYKFKFEYNECLENKKNEFEKTLIKEIKYLS